MNNVIRILSIFSLFLLSGAAHAFQMDCGGRTLSLAFQNPADPAAVPTIWGRNQWTINDFGLGLVRLGVQT